MHVGTSWIASVRVADITPDDKYHTESDITGDQSHFVLHATSPPRDFVIVIDPDTIKIDYWHLQDRPYVDSIQRTIFFFGGVLRIGDGYPFQHDPILEVGKTWTRPAASHTMHTGSSGDNTGYSNVHGSALVTDVGRGHTSCGSTTDMVSFVVSYLGVARVHATILDGFPFPVSGVASDRGAGTERIYGDSRVDAPFWYRLVEHSKSVADAGAGGLCRLASEMRDGQQKIRVVAGTSLSGKNDTMPYDGAGNMALHGEDVMQGDHITVQGKIPIHITGAVTISIRNATDDQILRFKTPVGDDGTYAVHIGTETWNNGTYIILAEYGEHIIPSRYIIGADSMSLPDADRPYDPLSRIRIKNLMLSYDITGGDILGVQAHRDTRTIAILIDAKNSGLLVLRIPVEVSAIIGGPHYDVLVDHLPAAGHKIISDGRDAILMVPFASGSDEVRVVGGMADER